VVDEHNLIGIKDVAVKVTTHIEPSDFSLVLGGPLYQLYPRTRLARAPIAELVSISLTSVEDSSLVKCAPSRSAGGLGFLGNSVFAFAPVLLAHTILLSAFMMSRIWHEGAVLPDFKLEIFGIVGSL
jgi:hypothetical protein